MTRLPYELTDEQQTQVTAYLAGDMSHDERKAFENRAVHNPGLADAIYNQQATHELLLEAKAQAAVRAAGEAKVLTLTPRPWWHHWGFKLGAPLAAAAALLIALPNLKQTDEPVPAFRGDQEHPVLVSPQGATSDPVVHFTWEASANAASYRLEVYDQELRLLSEQVTDQTSIALPRSSFGRLATPTLMWKVVPISPTGLEGSASKLVSFTLE